MPQTARPARSFRALGALLALPALPRALAQATVSPFATCAEVELKAPREVDEGHEWGAAVAATAGVFAVGSDGDRGGFVAGSQQGLVALYRVRAAADGQATRAQTLTADDGAVGDEFGSALAINAAGMMVVGAPRRSRVYFYRVDVTTARATLVDKAMRSDQTADFGYAVAMDEQDSATGQSLVAVGARLDDGAATNAGAVVLYRMNGTLVTAVHALRASDAVAGDEFGRALALREGLLAVGAPFSDDDGDLSGSVYLYRVAATGTGAGAVQLVHKLTASDAAAYDRFGSAVALSASQLLAVGAPLEDTAASNAGAVYVYEVASSGTGAGAVTEVDKIAGGPDTDDDDDFGASVALDGDLLAVGAPKRGGSNGQFGAVYLYAVNATSAVYQRKYNGPGAGSDPRFGRAVALFDSSVVIGAPYKDSYKGDASNFRCASSTRMPLLFSTLDYSSFDAAALTDAIYDAFDACCGSADDDIFKMTYYPGSVVADLQFANETHYDEALAAVEGGLIIEYGGSNYTATLANVRPAGSSDSHDERGSIAGAVIGGLLLVVFIALVVVIAMKQNKRGSNKIGSL